MHEEPRACTLQDLPEMIALVNAAMREGTDQNILTDYPLVYHERNLVNVSVLKADGHVVSVVPFLWHPAVMEGCRFRIGDISPTVTHPEHRKKGYATQCLDRSHQRMAEEGVELSVLWTLVRTFPFYEKSGYQAVSGQAWSYTCRPEDAAQFPDHGEEVVTLDPANPGQLQAIRTMHEREVTGVIRRPEEYAPLFSLPKMKTWLALRGGVPAAYLVDSRARNRPGFVEGGGQPQALETLLHRALGLLAPDEQRVAYAYFTPSVMGDLLDLRLPGRREPWPVAQMFRINGVRGFLERITPWIEKRCSGRRDDFSLEITDADELVSFHFSGGRLSPGNRRLPIHVALTRREFTSVVFGAHPERPVPVPDLLKGIFPFYVPIWMLDHS